jgi:hypothetical protein
MARDNDRFAKIEGRLRALEALFIEMPATTEKLVNSTKNRVRAKIRRKSPELADAISRLRSTGYLDEHAEGALDDLAYAVKSKKK